MTRGRPNRSGFEQRLLATLRTINLAPANRLTVGFSGGRDSLGLAAALSHIAPKISADVRLVHVDHQLRPGSGEDAEACRALAEELDVPIDVVQLDPNLTERATGMGIEEAARRERYVALSRAAASWGSSDLVLGHQANDQAETVLMHLFRGAAIDGLAGMRLAEQRRIPWWDGEPSEVWNGRLIRPLLGETRDEIDEYVREIGLKPVEDESNDSTDFDRNWVRWRVLPEIIERWPIAIGAMGRSAAALATDREFLERLSADASEGAIRDDRTLCTDIVVGVDPALAFRVIRSWLRELGIEEIDRDVIVRLHALALTGNESQRIEIGDGQVAVRDGQRLTTLVQLVNEASERIPIANPERVAAWGIELFADPQFESVTFSAPTAAQLVVRQLRMGDTWFGTHRAVREDLRAAGIHPALRDYILAVAAEDGVLLIPAIYPTIRSMNFDGPIKKVGVRWSRRS